MLDIKYIEQNPEKIKEILQKRFSKIKTQEVDKLLKNYTDWKKQKHEIDLLRQKRNQLSEQVNLLKKQKKSVEKVLKEIKEIPDKIKKYENEAEKIKNKVDASLKLLPNFLHEEVPIAESEDKNVTLRTFGKKSTLSFSPKSHVDLIEDLNLVEMDQAAKVSGARFYYLKNDLVELDEAVLQFARDTIKQKGFTLVRTPDILRKQAIQGAAELADFEETLYKIEDKEEELFLIATAEHTLLALHMDQVLQKLPLKYCGTSNCYRREAGAHGKDTKGIFRVHEFRKVEQVIYADPEKSWDYFKELIANTEEIFKALELPYRVISIVSGALNNAAAMKYDLEVWMPAQQLYREMVSCSNCLDYQARKLNIRFQNKGKLEYVHLLNCTAVATPRILAAILENYQQADGSVKIPKVLQKYMDGKTQIKKKN